MKKIIYILTFIALGFLAGYYCKPVEDHLLSPDKSKADIKLYNYPDYPDSMVTSDLLFVLINDFGECDMTGKMEIKTNGDIGICTDSGWKIHQSDQ